MLFITPMGKKWNYISTRIIMTCGLIGILYYCHTAETYSDESQRDKPLQIIDVAGIKLRVEIASTPEEHARGLMYRDTLGNNRGMLFIFPEEKILSFWMKNTRIPLSIAFIKGNGHIIQIDSMSPYSLEPHISQGQVKYALEMQEGWFKTHNVKIGDSVHIPHIPE